MQNAGLDEASAGIRTTGRSISNFRYADDTMVMAENKEVKTCFLVREEDGKAGLKLNIRKPEIVAWGPVTSWQTDGGQWKE